MDTGGQSKVIFQRSLLLRRKASQADGHQRIAQESFCLDALMANLTFAKVSGINAMQSVVNLRDELGCLLGRMVFQEVFELFQAGYELFAGGLQISTFDGRHM